MSKYKILSWVVVVIWMILIFAFSSQVAEQSNQLSSGITETIARIIETVFPNIEFGSGNSNHIVRKNAHFFVYLVLGVLMANAFIRTRGFDFKSILFAAGCCILYAISDEIHQLFVPGRGGQIKDVLIDSAGASVGLIFISLISWRKGLHKNKVLGKKH